MSSLDAIPPERGDSRGVAPATTVALLVVITVVLSIVTITGVFVISDDVEESPPQTVVGVESHSDGMLRITHEGGDPLHTEELSVVGPDTERDQLGDRTLTAGESLDVSVENSGTASIVWENGDTSATLETVQAPGMGNWTELKTKLENNEDITLQQDYTLNSPGYNEIFGSGSGGGISYSGTLDGNGHELKDVEIDRPGASKVGLIDTLTGDINNLGVVNLTVIGNDEIGLIGQNDGGTVSDVSVDGATVKSTADGFSNAGILVGINRGAIRDSSVSGSVTGENNIGGLAGYSNGDITGASAAGTVDGNDNAGGLVGQNVGQISESNAGVEVTGDYKVGGFAGWNSGTIENSYATGSVTSVGDGEGFGPGAVGGFVGVNQPDHTVSKSYATGTVSGPNSENVGGFVGNNGGTVQKSYATGGVTGDDSVGGFAGENGNLVSGVYATGGVTGNTNVGGLVGRLRGSSSRDGILRDSYFDDSSTGTGQSDAVGIIAPFGNTAEKRGEVTGLETSQMQGGVAPSNMAAFDFDSVWDTTAGYPVLQAVD